MIKTITAIFIFIVAVSAANYAIETYPVTGAIISGIMLVIAFVISIAGIIYQQVAHHER